MCETVSVALPDESPNAQPSTTIVFAIADLEDVSATELDFVLDDYVPADALDAVLGRKDLPGSDVRVELDLLGYDIVARSSGTVTVRRPCDDPQQCVAETNA